MRYTSTFRPHSRRLAQATGTHRFSSLSGAMRSTMRRTEDFHPQSLSARGPCCQQATCCPECHAAAQEAARWLPHSCQGHRCAPIEQFILCHKVCDAMSEGLPASTAFQCGPPAAHRPPVVLNAVELHEKLPCGPPSLTMPQGHTS